MKCMFMLHCGLYMCFMKMCIFTFAYTFLISVTLMISCSIRRELHNIMFLYAALVHLHELIMSSCLYNSSTARHDDSL